ncbi:MAG TPA: MFS transporter [Candidatus Binatia bacterium]|jgi:MFS family permease
MTTSDSQKRQGAEAVLSPFGHRDFRVFWTGSLLSTIGSQFTQVAMAWQIYELTNSPLQIGLLGLARAIPQIILLLVGGLLADAMNRRKLMMCTQTSLFFVSGALALLTYTGKASPAVLYVATMLLALFTSLDNPARQALIPSLVPREILPKALALNSSQRYVSVIAGPSLAGVILAVSGPEACYALDALSWLIMVLSLSRIRAGLQEGRGWSAVSLHSLREGLRFVSRHAVIFPLMLMDFGVMFFGSAKALLPIYARDILSVGPQGLGLLYAAGAAGSLTSAIGMSLFGAVRRPGRWIFSGVATFGLCTVFFAGSHTFWLSILLLAGAGAGDTISAILRGTTNQLGTPDELRGRMASINSIFTNTGPALGQFESGAVAGWLGAELSALTGGLATLGLLAGIAAAFPTIRRFQIAKELSLKEPRAAAAARPTTKNSQPIDYQP